MNHTINPTDELKKLQKKVDSLERKIGELETLLSVPRPKERLLGTAEACRYLEIGRSSLYRYIQNGMLGYSLVGKQRRFALTELDRFMDRRQTNALPSIL
jgi:excisionase family DNA binding protein